MRKSLVKPPLRKYALRRFTIVLGACLCAVAVVGGLAGCRQAPEQEELPKGTIYYTGKMAPKPNPAKNDNSAPKQAP